MKCGTLIELLQLLEKEYQDLPIIFEDEKFGKYAINEVALRPIAGFVVLRGAPSVKSLTKEIVDPDIRIVGNG